MLGKSLLRALGLSVLLFGNFWFCDYMLVSSSERSYYIRIRTGLKYYFLAKQMPSAYEALFMLVDSTIVFIYGCDKVMLRSL